MATLLGGGPPHSAAYHAMCADARTTSSVAIAAVVADAALDVRITDLEVGKRLVANGSKKGGAVTIATSHTKPGPGMHLPRGAGPHCVPGPAHPDAP